MSSWSLILEGKSTCKEMRTRGVILFLVFLGVLSADSLGLESSVGRGTVPVSSVGSGRVPESFYRGGLVRSPNPVDGSGNLVITGNVRGGKHFRGVVPYQSRYDLEVGLPSSSLDSFLRYSAGSEDVGRAPNKYSRTQPYYSGTGTVTTVRPSDRKVFQPPSTQVVTRAGSKSILPSLLKQEVSAGGDMTLLQRTPYSSAYTRLRPLSMGPEELERVILEETETAPKSEELIDEQHRPQIEPLLQDLKVAGDKTAGLKRDLLTEDRLLRLPTRAELGPEGLEMEDEEREKLEAKLGGQLAGEEVGEQENIVGVPSAQVDVYERMKLQISNMQRIPESTPVEPGLGQVTEPQAGAYGKREVEAPDEARGDDEEFLSMINKAQREDEASAEERRQRLVRTRERVSSLEEAGVEPGDGEAGLGLEGDLGTGPRDATQRRDVSAQSREGLTEYKTFASFSEDKFNRHMRAAEEYLKRGRFYRAADAYTLASIYKPDDPLAYAGKSHALFAAGEYMSSALFLSKALEIFPEYAQFKIDLVAMIGDKDKLESRVANVEEWLDESGAAELQFLLSYVYYQMGRQDDAARMVNAASENMPESPAVLALKKAITGGTLE